MQLQEAKDFIKHESGFRVTFEVREGGILRSDHFPEDDEPPFTTEDEAWEYAEKFAKAGRDKGIVNVYVIYADDWTPVKGYKEKELNYH